MNDPKSAPDGGLHIGMVLTSLAGGGAERVTLTLADALIRRGHRVDLLLLRPFGDFHDAIPHGTRVYYVPIRNPARLLRSCRKRGISIRPLWVGPLALARTWLGLRKRYPRDGTQGRGIRTRVRDVLKEVLSAASIARYAQVARPMLLYGTSVWTNIGVILAASRLSRPVATVASVHSVVSRGYQAGELARARQTYPEAGGVVGVCPSICAEVVRVVRVPHKLLHYLPNLLRLEDIRRKSHRPVHHPWFNDPQVPVLLTAGRPVPLKDHATLVRAFVRVRRQHRVRLVIMGGSSKSYRAGLRAVAGQSAQDLEFLDFDENPYRYMRRARMVVLSSRYEACAMVLVEAMACGLAVVSTDAPNGPADLLGRGRWGALVPVGDPVALAKALIRVLDGDSVPVPEMRRRAQDFDADRMAVAYEELFATLAGQASRKDKRSGGFSGGGEGQRGP